MNKIKLHMCNQDGEFMATIDYQCIDGFGLPALSSTEDMPTVPVGHKLYLVAGEWMTTEFYIGRQYWLSNGVAVEITQRDVYPPDAIFVQPPPEEEGFVFIYDGEWLKVEDHREKLAYYKDHERVDVLHIEELGPVPDECTLKEPIMFGIWSEEENAWVESYELKKQFHSFEERAWRDAVMGPILNRINQYQMELNMPEEFRVSPLSENDYRNLLTDYRVLCDYPQQPDFPYGKRPDLLGPV